MTVLHAFGTKFQRETVTPGTYADIAQVVNISGPSLSRDTVDATNHASTSRWKEFIGGLRDAGEVTVELQFDPDSTGHADLRSDLAVDAVHNYRIIFTDPTPTQWTFAALVTRFEPRAPHDEKLTATVSLKLSGVPTFA